MALLHGILGSSKSEIWSQIARDIGGEYINDGFWDEDILSYRHGEWEFLLDTYTRKSSYGTVTYTRMRVPFRNKDGLRFTVYHEGFFSTIGKFLGMQDIEIGDNSFDDKFIIKANNEAKVKQLLGDQKLKALFNRQPDIYIEIKKDEGWFGPDYPKGIDVLYFECIGVINEKRALLNLFELFTTVLNRLVHIDSAYTDDPEISLR